MAEADIGRMFTCSQCGSEQAQRIGRGRRWTRCDECRKPKRSLADIRSGSPCNRDHSCEGCGSRFRPKKTDRVRYCSRECSLAAQRKAAEIEAERRRLLLPEVRALRQVASGMSSSLRRLSLLRERRQRALIKCGHCAKPVGVRRTKTFPARYCSDKCAQAHPEAVERKRTFRLKRKARQRAATVESVNALRVFERDGWRCHLCGELTLKAKRGTCHPKAPELDHIVPLSKGGEHSYRNTACAHRSCNAAKSDAIIGQPSLFAA